QTKAVGGLQGWIEPHAVVCDLESRVAIRDSQPHSDSPGMCVLQHVVECLLCQAIEFLLFIRWEPFVAGAVELRHQARARLHGPQSCTERRRQALLLQQW